MVRIADYLKSLAIEAEIGAGVTREQARRRVEAQMARVESRSAREERLEIRRGKDAAATMRVDARRADLERKGEVGRYTREDAWHRAASAERGETQRLETRQGEIAAHAYRMKELRESATAEALSPELRKLLRALEREAKGENKEKDWIERRLATLRDRAYVRAEAAIARAIRASKGDSLKKEFLEHLRGALAAGDKVTPEYVEKVLSDPLEFVKALENWWAEKHSDLGPPVVPPEKPPEVPGADPCKDPPPECCAECDKTKEICTCRKKDPVSPEGRTSGKGPPSNEQPGRGGPTPSLMPAGTTQTGAGGKVGGGFVYAPPKRPYGSEGDTATVSRPPPPPPPPPDTSSEETEPLCVVPHLIGLSEADAASISEQLGFKAKPQPTRSGSGPLRHDNRQLVTKPVVQEQTLPPGSLAPCSKRVAVTYGRPEDVVVPIPDLTLLPKDAVVKWLKQRGIEKVVVLGSTDLNARVMAQLPPPGFGVAVGGEVLLAVDLMEEDKEARWRAVRDAPSAYAQEYWNFVKDDSELASAARNSLWSLADLWYGEGLSDSERAHLERAANDALAALRTAAARLESRKATLERSVEWAKHSALGAFVQGLADFAVGIVEGAVSALSFNLVNHLPIPALLPDAAARHGGFGVGFTGGSIAEGALFAEVMAGLGLSGRLRLTGGFTLPGGGPAGSFRRSAKVTEELLAAAGSPKFTQRARALGFSDESIAALATRIRRMKVGETLTGGWSDAEKILIGRFGVISSRQQRILHELGHVLDDVANPGLFAEASRPGFGYSGFLRAERTAFSMQYGPGTVRGAVMAPLTAFAEVHPIIAYGSLAAADVYVSYRLVRVIQEESR